MKELLVDAYEAHWSPDGAKLAFLRHAASQEAELGTPSELYVMRADGTGLKRVTRLVRPYPVGGLSLTWSPDGKRIAYRDLASRRAVIAAVGENGGSKRRLTQGDQPRWSPDGRRIAFTREGSLYVMNADGTRQRRITRWSGVWLSPQSWSPDGKRITFYRCCLKGFGVADVDRGRVRTFLDGRVVLPSWSPNGRWIALAGGGTFRIKPDGTGLRRISDLGEPPFPAEWSPDSRAVAVEDRCCAPDVWVVAADGSGQRRLTAGWRYGYGNYDPEWQPKGLPTSKLAGRYVERSIPTDTVAQDGVLQATRPIEHLAADGSGVVVRYQGGSCEAWEPLARSLIRFRDGCGRPGFAGGRIAWVSGPFSGLGVDRWYVYTGTLAIPRVVSVNSLWRDSRPLSDPIGDGSVLAFSSWGPCRISQNPPCASDPKKNGELYRLEGTRARLIASSPGPLTPLSVDAGRILVDRGEGQLELLTADATSLRTFRLNAAIVRGARVQGSDLVVLTPSAVEVTSAETGAFLRRWPAPAADARLEDVQDGVALLVVKNDLHLVRISDGRTALISPPGSGPVLAQLEPSGLFYSYQADDARYPGRVAFVPFDRLPFR